MAVPVDVRYPIPAWRGVKAGTFIGGKLAGVLQADDMLASGSFGVQPLGLTGSVAMADAMAAGTLEGVVVPEWSKDRTVAEWYSIVGTSNSGTQVDNYCGWTHRPDTGEIYIAASSGHDVNDNCVASISMFDDAPSWRERTPASPTKRRNAAYNDDGQPAGRHTYYANIWVPAPLERVVMFGARFVWGEGPPELYMMDGWDPETETWDRGETYNGGPAGNNASYNNDGTYGRIVPGFWGAAIDGDGNVWSQFGGRKWTASTQTWSAPFGSGTPGPRGPWAYDSLRKQMFSLCWSSNEGGSGPASAARFNTDGTAFEAITIAPSQAFTEYQQDQPAYAGLVYDNDLDRFLLLDGRVAGRAGRVYVITPSSGTTYEMSVLPTTGELPLVVSAGLNSRLTYISSLKTLICMPSDAAGIFGMLLG